MPAFILLVSLAGRRWGTTVAGILAGMPVVAGPIVVLVALEQGVGFGIYTATAAVTGVIALLSFGIAYCWLSLKLNWWMTFLLATLVWSVISSFLVLLPQNIYLALCIALLGLIFTPYLLPRKNWVYRPAAHAKDLPVRMLAGGVFTLIVTQAADLVGGTWSGLLAVFPIIGSILAVFTHITQGADAVTTLYGVQYGAYIRLYFSFYIGNGMAIYEFLVCAYPCHNCSNHSAIAISICNETTYLFKQ
ncbi:hypothetical protein QJS67_05770 [Acinetobacter radioresistens]|nr:hypothetical protein QJS67_05770 [Acinetobacter radioresistens]